MASEDERPSSSLSTVGIDSIELPYYATYSKQPTGGRVILPPDHQIQYTLPLPWDKQKELGEQHSDVKITATNRIKPRTVDVDLEEDDGAYATYIPVAYQLPPSDEVIRNQINSPELNDISDKLDSLKEDITKSIGKLLKNSGSCRLCNIFNTEDSRFAEKSCGHPSFHGTASKYYKPKPSTYSYNPEFDFEQDMKKLMRPKDVPTYYVPTIPGLPSRAEREEGRRRNIQEEINKKAALVPRYALSPVWKSQAEKDRYRRALELPPPYPEDDEDDFPWRLSPLPSYRNSRYPTDHLLTRRRGYKFIT